MKALKEALFSRKNINQQEIKQYIISEVITNEYLILTVVNNKDIVFFDCFNECVISLSNINSMWDYKFEESTVSKLKYRIKEVINKNTKFYDISNFQGSIDVIYTTLKKFDNYPCADFNINYIIKCISNVTDTNLKEVNIKNNLK